MIMITKIAYLFLCCVFAITKYWLYCSANENIIGDPKMQNDYSSIILSFFFIYEGILLFSLLLFVHILIALDIHCYIFGSSLLNVPITLSIAITIPTIAIAIVFAFFSILEANSFPLLFAIAFKSEKGRQLLMS